MYWLLGAYLLTGLLIAFRTFTAARTSVYSKATIVQGFIQLTIGWAVYLPLALFMVWRDRRVHGRSTSENVQM